MGVPLGVMNRSRKDDDRIRGQTICQIDEVHVFLDHGDEEVVLQKRGNSGISGRCR